LAVNWQVHRDAARRAQTVAVARPGARAGTGTAIAP